MGFGSFLFGGSSYKKVPGSQEWLDRLKDFDPFMYGGRGIGYLGKAARQDLRDMRAGKDISTIGGMSGILGAINATRDATKRQTMADYDAGAAATELRNHPELMEAQKRSLASDIDFDASQNVVMGAKDLYDRTAGMFQNAFSDQQNRRLQGAQMKLNSLTGGLQGNNSSYNLVQSGGLISKLGQLGGLAAIPFSGGLSAGMFGLGAGGRAAAAMADPRRMGSFFNR